MVTRKRNRARILTPEGLRKLNEQIRQRELDDNAGSKLSLEKLGELTGLDPETVKKVVDRQGSDRRTLTRCFGVFGLTLTDTDYEPATQAIAQQSDPNFVGREEAMTDLNALVSRNAQVIVIQARGGVGKTTLARRYLLQVFGAYLEFPIAKETKDIANVESLLEEKLRQLGEEPGREFLVSLDRLKRKLQEKPIGILIDNLEPALDSAGKFIEPHRRYIELLRVLADPTVQSTTLITSRERLRESSISVQHYLLQSLAVAAWEQFFASRGLVANTPAITALHKAYGGNAKAMEIVSSAILEDFEGDVEAYWDFNQEDLFVERDLEDLVVQQFDRLKTLDPNAYDLLCRMGCYRYQDIPTVPLEGLFCLLWDVDSRLHKRSIKSLIERHLIEYESGEYSLHPVIRSEAIARLKSTKDWLAANQEAQMFWNTRTSSIQSLHDALVSFEAYFHCLEIQDFEGASQVLTRRLPDELHHEISLGGILYRIGLTSQIIFATERILPYLTSEYETGLLYHILADSHRVQGKIKSSINYNLRAIQHFQSILDSGPEDTKGHLAYAHLSNGIYFIDLWELDEAKKYFHFVINNSDRKYRIVAKSEACLAYINSCTGLACEAKVLLDRVEEQIEIEREQGTLGNIIYFLIFTALTYKNLDEFETSMRLYEKIISYLRGTSYQHTMAKALYGVGEVHRITGELDLALQKCVKAVEILRYLDAKVDLAEALFQLGLTYKAMKKFEDCKKHLKEAVRLFSDIEAPKQVERVKQAMVGV